MGGKIPDSWHAGCIREIFTYTHHRHGPTTWSTPEMTGYTETYFVIEKFKELTESDALHNPYRKQPFVAGRLFYNTFEDNLELVELREILCHVAYTPVSMTSIGIQVTSRCIHVLPLDCVSYTQTTFKILCLRELMCTTQD